MDFKQAAAILNAVNNQVTGKTTLAPIDITQFVSVATTTLNVGVDPTLKAISDILAKTVFRYRKYARRFGGIEVDNQRFGAITRKINYIDSDAVNTKFVDLQDGQSVDQYEIHKPKVVQTNFYDAQMFERCITRFEDQLTCAFTGPDELSEFWMGALGEMDNQVDQDTESMARLCIANFIAGISDAKSVPQVIHLLTEYKAETGLELTAQQVMAPDNFPAFMQWVYGRIAGISSMLEERTLRYHLNITGKEIKRHTPMENQNVFLYAPTQYMYTSRVLADTYHDNLIKYANYMPLNFWQALDHPQSVSVKPSYLNVAGGGVKQAAGNVAVDNIFGVIADTEALGYTIFAKKTRATPVNARGDYFNLWYKYVVRYWNDFTENFVLLLLD